MHRASWYAAGLLVCLAFAPARAAAPPETPQLPSSEEMHKQFEAKDYQGVLRDVGHALALNEKKLAEVGYDKYDLLMLRGETQLRLKQTSPALQAFHEAARATKDPQQASVALATEMLVRRSKQGQFTPKKPAEKGGKVEPLDILDPDKRKQAFEALYNEEREAAGSSLKAAKTASSLPQVESAIKSIQSHQLLALDRAAHGSPQDMEDIAKDLKERTQDMISKALERLAKQVDDIDARANETVRIPQVIQNPRVGIAQQDIVHRRGLQSGDRQNLQGISRSAAKIALAAKEIIGSLSDNADDAKDIIQQAEDLQQKAEKTLRADYGN